MKAYAAIAAAVLAGCTSVSSNIGPGVPHDRSTLTVCHGFDCRNKSQVSLGRGGAARLAAIMARGRSSPQAERDAVAAAVAYAERRASEEIGVPDRPQSSLGQTGERGQMDCIDESTNTRTVLLWLKARGLLRHHSVEANVTRGALIDGRYFHATAVLRDPTGQRWAIDSWYEPAGGRPDVMRLETWLGRGVFGRR